MDLLKLRQANNNDQPWLWQLYCHNLKSYIEQTWGWQEKVQRNIFKSNLHPEKFLIVSLQDNTDIGAYIFNEHPDHFWLEMLLISQTYQGQGYGRQIVARMQQQAVAIHKPIRLCVIKTNPAVTFYKKLGFVLESTDDGVHNMGWRSA